MGGIRATQDDLIDRRLHMLYLTRLGIKPKDWIEEIAFKYHSTPEAVRRDWGNRKRWIKQILKIGDAEGLVLDILFDYEKAIIDAYKLYAGTDELNSKIQALWLRLKAIKMRETYLKNIGALEQITADFQNEAEEHKRELEEERYPYLKGDRDRHIRSMALLKTRLRGDAFHERQH